MSSNGTGARAKRMDLAFAALLSKDDEEALAAITRIDQEGDAKAIRPLLVALAKGPSPTVQQRITALLHQLKAPHADEVLLAALKDPELRAVRATVLSTFWCAGIDVRDHLLTFVELAIEGDAAECMECLTIVENQEVWPEKEARRALKRVEDAVGAEADTYKLALLRDLEAALRYRLGKE